MMEWIMVFASCVVLDGEEMCKGGVVPVWFESEDACLAATVPVSLEVAREAFNLNAKPFFFETRCVEVEKPGEPA